MINNDYGKWYTEALFSKLTLVRKKDARNQPKGGHSDILMMKSALLADHKHPGMQVNSI